MASKVNDARANRVIVGLTPALYDRVDVSYPDSVTEVYTFYYNYGTADQSTAGVVTLIYTDATKDDLASAERTT